MPTHIFLLRHGQTDWNPIGRVMGPKPIPLNETGREQAAKAGEWLREVPLAAVYSSPMLRAVETAEIAMGNRNGLKVVSEEKIREIDYGFWVGMMFEEVKNQYAAEWIAYRQKPDGMVVPGGEGVADVQKRAVSFVEEVRKKHADESVLLVSHADVVKSIVIHYLGLPLNHFQKVGSDNGGVTILCFDTAWGDRVPAVNVGPNATHLIRDLA